MKVTDKIEITNEDNMELMARYPDNYFDLAIVDPPYGINESGDRNKADRPTLKWKNPSSQIYKTFDDTSIPNKEYFNELFRVSKNQIIWGGNYMTEFLKPSKGWIVWNKKADIKEYLSMAELAWSSFDKKCNMFDYLWAGFKKKHQVQRIHPTQKPVDLYKWMLEHYAKQGDKILDTHLGSGSIAIACHDYNFDLTACELDKEYFDKAIQRIKNHVSQQKLFL
jgi:site-specific DNA-methyltransferase (adenine-specific)